MNSTEAEQGSQKTIAITTTSFAKWDETPLRLLAQAGLAVRRNLHGRKLTAEEAREMLAGCVGVIAGTEPLTAQVLGALPGLRAISRLGVGLDNVDLEAAARLGIRVDIAPEGLANAVAELTLGVLLDLLRHISRMDRELRAGIWTKRTGGLLRGRRVGLVGYGRIGRATAHLLAAFEAEVAYADPCVAPEPDGPRRMTLEELLPWAEVVSLHCPGQANGGALLGAEALGGMRPGALLINCARGGLVDEQALAQALEQGHLAGAALDGFAVEPYAGPLQGFENVVLTPHVGSYAREARVRMELQAAQNLLLALGLDACGGASD